MPTDPRRTPQVTNLASELRELEYDAFVRRLRTVRDDDALGWVRYQFLDGAESVRAWQVIAINRWLERDKFFRNILPQWIGSVFGILSFAVAVLALVVALNPPKP